MGCLRCCSILVAVVAVLLGAVYSGLLARSGALQFLDSMDNGRGLRWRGELPFLVPTPWLFTTKDIPDLTGQVILVTGGNSGMGYWTAVHLARANATVVVACRSLVKCQQACADIEAEVSGIAKVVPMTLDLTSFASIRKFAKDFASNFTCLDSLILNAGVMLQPFQLTADGLELTMGTNHFGHFLVTKLLLPLLEVAVTKHGVATVSVHSSAALFESKPAEGLLLEQLRPVTEPSGNATWYDPFDAYVKSKLANVLFAQELAARVADKGILVNAHAPGAVRTNLLKHILGDMTADGPVFGSGGKIEETLGAWGRYLLLKYVAPVHKIVWDPADAALTQVYTSVSPQLKTKKTTGRYFQSVARLVEPDVHCKNATLQKWLWELSETVTSN